MIELIIKSLQQINEQMPQGPDGFTGEFCKTLKRKKIKVTYTQSKIKEDRIFPNLCYEVMQNPDIKP